MKQTVKALITIGVALVLISGVAYAADRKKKAQQPGCPPGAPPDDEAVKAELLATVEVQQKIVPRKDNGVPAKGKEPAIDKQSKK